MLVKSSHLSSLKNEFKVVVNFCSTPEQLGTQVRMPHILVQQNCVFSKMLKLFGTKLVQHLIFNAIGCNLLRWLAALIDCRSASSAETPLSPVGQLWPLIFPVPRRRSSHYSIKKTLFRKRIKKTVKLL